MSEGYASRLSPYGNKGVCGLPERRDTGRTLLLKMKKLTELVRGANRIVVLTGAGISTNAGIPDFRGPNGIWTNEKKRKRDSKEVMDFSKASPSLTHRALVKMIDLGILDFVITQNVDGLHRRSGLSRDRHAVLHGCVFTEECEKCNTEHFRDFDVGGMSFKTTGRKCDHCGGDLRDMLLDWDDELPEADFARCKEECEQADLVIVLGSSLRITPAGSLPTLARKFAIVNFQQTPYDQVATLKLHADVDYVMDELLKQLGHEDWDKGDRKPAVERYWKRSSSSGTT